MATAAVQSTDGLQDAMHVEPRALTRIEVLDVLRGIALLGMYAVHFNHYESTPLGTDPGRTAAFVERTLYLFFDERFYAIFGMLFGVGFAVQLARADARGEPFVARFLRRLVGLAIFGFIAEGVFGYNVLLGYAMWGLPLLLIRRWPVKALVVLLILCASSRSLYNLTRVAIYNTKPSGMVQLRAVNEERFARFSAARTRYIEAQQAPDWKTVVAERIRFMPAFHWQWSTLPSGSFTLFVLGLIAFRLGLFSKPEQHRRLIASLMIAGVASWVIAAWVLPIGGPTPQPLPEENSLLTAVVTTARTTAFSLIREQWLAFTYVGAILLVAAHGGAALRRLAPLGWAGRMALTNYMTQVILLDVLFTPHGLGLKVPATMVFVGAAVLFAVQAMLSRWWLKRYTAGVLEWLWRWFTTWERPTFRRADLQPLSGATSAAIVR